jgi:hypothetical protein
LAITKIIALKTRIDVAIKYATNKEKTVLKNAVVYAVNPAKNMGRVFEGSCGCSIDDAHAQMKETKDSYGKKGGVLGYHIIQSFAPNEVTPEQAFAISSEFVYRYLALKYEAVWSTHVDKNHIHSHIVFNSVSYVDGKKYVSNKKTYAEIMRISDELCREYGLSVIVPSTQNKPLSYADWNSVQSGKKTYKQLIREDIDQAISESFSYGEFLVTMEEMGYDIKMGKHVAFRPPGKERFSRGHNLGAGYSEDEIRARIENSPLPPIGAYPELTTYQKQQFERSKYIPDVERKYWRWMFMLGLVKKRQAQPRMTKYLKGELEKLERYKEQQKFLKTHEIGTTNEFYNYKAKLNDKLEEQKRLLDPVDTELNKHKTVFKALSDMSKYEHAYDMYLDGYDMFKDEHELYINAKAKLDKYPINELWKKKVELYKSKEEIKKAVRGIRSELRICKNIEGTMEYMKEKEALIDNLSKKKAMGAKERE